jgi:hypothetical protein
MACMTLPFSSATSRTQSVLPVATSTWVLQPLTKPYRSSSSSILKPLGYCTEQLSQSWSQSSPSTALSTTGNRSASAALLPELPMASDFALLMSDLNADAMVAALCLFAASCPLRLVLFCSLLLELAARNPSGGNGDGAVPTQKDGIARSRVPESWWVMSAGSELAGQAVGVP